MLSELDDTLWHQLPTTFDHVGTSDPRFYDRYWFAAYDAGGAGALQLTMGVYNNMNVVDCGFVLITQGTQRNIRASRSLRPNFNNICGPLEIQVLEPLRHIRMTISDGPHPVSGQMDWIAAGPPEEERPHFQRHSGRIVEDYQRFNQIGTLSGSLNVDGKALAIDNWWACRDHSWGVRPDMGVPEPVNKAASLPPQSIFFAFLFFSTDKYAGHIQLSRRLGRRYMTGLIRQDGGENVPVLACDADIEFIENTSRFSKVTLRVKLATGEEIVLIADALGSSIAMTGLGYGASTATQLGGWDDGRGLGKWRGDSHVEFDTWDVSHPVDVVWADGKIHRPAHRIQPVRITCDNGSRGTGSLTLIAVGDLPLLHFEAH